jgi:hypothetical protein
MKILLTLALIALVGGVVYMLTRDAQKSSIIRADTSKEPDSTPADAGTATVVISDSAFAAGFGGTTGIGPGIKGLGAIGL